MKYIKRIKEPSLSALLRPYSVGSWRGPALGNRRVLCGHVPLGVKEKPRITVRPYDMFFEDVTVEGKEQSRYCYIGEEAPSDLSSKYSPLSK